LAQVIDSGKALFFNVQASVAVEKWDRSIEPEVSPAKKELQAN